MTSQRAWGGSEGRNEEKFDENLRFDRRNLQESKFSNQNFTEYTAVTNKTATIERWTFKFSSVTISVSSKLKKLSAKLYKFEIKTQNRCNRIVSYSNCQKLKLSTNKCLSSNCQNSSANFDSHTSSHPSGSQKLVSFCFISPSLSLQRANNFSRSFFSAFYVKNKENQK